MSLIVKLCLVTRIWALRVLMADTVVLSTCLLLHSITGNLAAEEIAPTHRLSDCGHGFCLGLPGIAVRVSDWILSEDLLTDAVGRLSS